MSSLKTFSRSESVKRIGRRSLPALLLAPFALFAKNPEEQPAEIPSVEWAEGHLGRKTHVDEGSVKTQWFTNQEGRAVFEEIISTGGLNYKLTGKRFICLVAKDDQSRFWRWNLEIPKSMTNAQAEELVKLNRKS